MLRTLSSEVFQDKFSCNYLCIQNPYMYKSYSLGINGVFTSTAVLLIYSSPGYKMAHTLKKYCVPSCSPSTMYSVALGSYTSHASRPVPDWIKWYASTSQLYGELTQLRRAVKGDRAAPWTSVGRMSKLLGLKAAINSNNRCKQLLYEFGRADCVFSNQCISHQTKLN